MAFCRLGPIPHSEFHGWDEIDQAKAVAYERWLADHCRNCGQKRSEWRDEHGVELRHPPFEVVKSRCPSCEMLADQQEADQEEAKKDPNAPKQHGVFYSFKRVE